MLVNATQLTAIMVRSIADWDAVQASHEKGKCRAYVLGPGFGDFDRARRYVSGILELEDGPSLVLDADGITAFRDEPDSLFKASAEGTLRVILTPHEGEFGRLFPDLPEDDALLRVEKAGQAAKRASAVVILKGEESVIASPDGRVALNRNATPFLATAGSGDVLSGFCGGLLAQEMPPFEAACAAVWLHAEVATRFGPGLIAEDLPEGLPAVLAELAPEVYRPRGGGR